MIKNRSDTECAREALYRSKQKYEIIFNAALTPMKRNLLFVSLLSFASLMVSPKDGVYSINLGVISGIVEQPHLVFGGLFVVCWYHIYQYWINCRQSILNSVNYAGVQDVYMYELSSIHAIREWNNISATKSQGSNMAVMSFVISPKDPKENGCWKVRSRIESAHLNSHQHMVDALNENKRFTLSENRGFSEIDYSYSPTIEDYQYLNLHKDQFWLTKKKEFIEYVFPILLGFVASLGLVYKVIVLVGICS